MDDVTGFCEQVVNGSVLLTVNQRLARHRSVQFQQWQQAQGALWWETPEILPFRSWLLALHAHYLATGESEKTLLPDLLQQRLWQQCIDNDDAVALLDSEAACRSAKRAWDIACAWDCHPADDDYLPLDQYTWKRWQASYQSKLDEQGCIDEASLADHLRDILMAGVVAGEGAGASAGASAGVGADEVASLGGGAGGSALPDHIILDGFLQLPPQLKAIVAALQMRGVKVEVLEANACALVHDVAYEDDARELIGVATHMRCELERDAAQSLGLVVPDLQNRRAEVLRAFDQVFFPGLSPTQIRDKGRPYDLSIGLPLSDTAPVQAALSILRLSTAGIQGNEISSLLLSPYMSGRPSDAHAKEQLDKRLRELRVRKLSLEELAVQLDGRGSLAKPVNKLLTQRKFTKATLSTWASRFSQWLTTFGWPGKGIDTEEYQAVSAWVECLDDLQLLDDNVGVDAQSAFRLLSRLARERVFQLETPATPIQIMGRLESHGISFECLWVTGLDTEQWPPTGSPSPFLPIAQQKEAGVPDASASARLQLAEQEFLRWSSQAPLLLASRALARDGKELDAAHLPAVVASDDNQTKAAPRIDRLGEYEAFVNPVAALRAHLQLECIQDNYGPALPAGTIAKGGARLFENQALCPFKSFALHRLAIRPLEEAGLGLDPRQHGTLLHHALELFWQRISTHSQLVALSEDELNEALLEVINVAIEEMGVPGALQDLERTRLLGLLTEWLMGQESIRPDFEVQSLELSQEIEHGGVIMNVMLDRIDKIGDDLVVVDYKTGTSSKVNTWADKRIVNPQLPLYVLTNEAIKGASFAQVARNQCKFIGVASESDMIPKVKTTVIKSRNGQATDRELETWDDWRLHWKEALDTVAGEVRQGLASVTPMDKACTHCELKSLCRVGDEQLTAVDDDDDGSSASPAAASNGAAQ